MTVTDEQFQLLLRQQAMLTKIARLTLEGKLTGADGAAGTLVALEGGQTKIDVAPFVFDE